MYLLMLTLTSKYVNVIVDTLLPRNKSGTHLQLLKIVNEVMDIVIFYIAVTHVSLEIISSRLRYANEIKNFAIIYL